MTYPQQPGGTDPQTPQTPPVPPASPQVPSPYEGTPASYGQPVPSAPPAGVPAAPPAGAPPVSPYEAPATYGTPASPGAPQHGVPDPYAAGPYASSSAAGPQPMSWRTILGYVFGVIAVLFFPIVFGVLGIVFAALAVKRQEKTAGIALGVAIAGTIIGFILGYMATASM